MEEMLNGKTALVTGGAGGIGLATALLFAEQGARIVIADNNADAIASAAEKLPAEAGHSCQQCDVTDSAQVRKLFSHVDREYGALDILVNNVGDFLGLVKPLENMTDDDIDRLFSVNLRQVMICSREAIPLMRKATPGAAIISISSIEGYRGMPNITPYGAYKLGIEGFTKSLALELAPDRIRVNAIAPETTETEQVNPREWISEQDYNRPNHWVPLGRFGQPGDTAGCALFLASEMAAWVTGTVIHCDGGALAAAGWYQTPEGHWTNTPIVDRSGIPSLRVD
ncbi:MAG: SDR family NAD(P)-dependent oxidoreductase [Halieaceae bacterium]